ncbi:MAG: rhomboid family intramembrane serine protease [Planctomycetes bacterium]|nr:rhomboid family intramembrane serine protease [Planctomycetota bacterium]
MLIPLLDRPWNRRTPWATYALIGANVAFFVYACVGIGLVPYSTSTLVRFGVRLDGFAAHTLFSHIYLHAGWGHVAGNMFFLGFFGRNLERRVGALAFLALYHLCGFAAAAAHVLWVSLTGRGADVPMVGASGAVFGVLGLYTAAFAGREVRVLLPRVNLLPGTPIRFTWTDTYLAAYWLGLVYLLWNVIDGLFLDRLTGVAHWAHVGGFAAGLLAGLFLFRALGIRGLAEEVLPAEASRIEDEEFEELGYIPGAGDDRGSARGLTRPVRRLWRSGGTLLVPRLSPGDREPVQTRRVLPGDLDHAVLLCHDGRVSEPKMIRLLALAQDRHGSRRGRWAPFGVLNRTLTAEGAELARRELVLSGRSAVVVPARELLPFPDAAILARLALVHDGADLVDYRGRVVHRSVDGLVLLVAGRTRVAPDAPYFADLFSFPPLERWRVNKANFDFSASGVSPRRTVHESFQALLELLVRRFPALPLSSSAVDLLQSRHPRGYTFLSLEEYEHHADWVLQMLGLAAGVGG